MGLSSIQDIIEDIRQGKMVILMDDENRENEGDLIMGAQWVRPEDINFMAQYGRGLVCLTLTRERCEQLKLPLMVNDTNDKHSTNFTVSIEAAKGVTTGISAADRAATIRAAVASEAGPQDIVTPGHIFPIMAQPGGVLMRAGHTEAGCDLARLAGLEPSSAIVEILNPDGTMARRPELEIFAEEHGLKMGTIADLIEYRTRNENTVTRAAECTLPTEFGDFHMMAYKDEIEGEVHIALVRGDISADKPTLVRVHVRDDLTDVLSGKREGFPLPLRKAMAQIGKAENGVVILLRKKEDPMALVRRIRNCKMMESGGEIPQPSQSDDLRTYGVGAQILVDLGVKRMNIIAHPRKMHALSGFGLEVENFVELESN